MTAADVGREQQRSEVSRTRPSTGVRAVLRGRQMCVLRAQCPAVSHCCWG